MKKRLLDLGRIVYAVNTSISPSHYLAFRLYDEFGVEYEVRGFPKIAADFGWLLASVISPDAASTVAEHEGSLVCAYRPLLAYIADHTKKGDLDSVCRLHGEVKLPKAFAAEKICRELGVKEPVGVEDEEPLRIDFSDPRLARRVAERDIVDPFSHDAMARAASDRAATMPKRGGKPQ